MTKEVVFAIVDPFFVGDLRKLSLSYHVWVALTPRNKIAHDAACAADSREYSPHYGLSGLDWRGDALSTLYEILEKIDVHHDEDSSEPPWDEIHVLGLGSYQLDTATVEEALSGTRVNISRSSDVVIIQRVVPQAGGVILKGPFAG